MVLDGDLHQAVAPGEVPVSRVEDEELAAGAALQHGGAVAVQHGEPGLQRVTAAGILGGIPGAQLGQHAADGVGEGDGFARIEPGVRVFLVAMGAVAVVQRAATGQARP